MLQGIYCVAQENSSSSVVQRCQKVAQPITFSNFPVFIFGILSFKQSHFQKISRLYPKISLACWLFWITIPFSKLGWDPRFDPNLPTWPWLFWCDFWGRTLGVTDLRSWALKMSLMSPEFLTYPEAFQFWICLISVPLLQLPNSPVNG